MCLQCLSSLVEVGAVFLPVSLTEIGVASLPVSLVEVGVASLPVSLNEVEVSSVPVSLGVASVPDSLIDVGEVKDTVKEAWPFRPNKEEVCPMCALVSGLVVTYLTVHLCYFLGYENVRVLEKKIMSCVSNPISLSLSLALSGHGSPEESSGGPFSQHRIGSVIPGTSAAGHQHAALVSRPRAACHSQVDSSRHHHGNTVVKQDACLFPPRLFLTLPPPPLFFSLLLQAERHHMVSKSGFLFTVPLKFSPFHKKIKSRGILSRDATVFLR